MNSEKFILLLSIITLSYSIYPIAVFNCIIDSRTMKNASMLVNDLKNDLGVHVECIEVSNGYWDSL